MILLNLASFYHFITLVRFKKPKTDTFNNLDVTSFRKVDTAHATNTIRTSDVVKFLKNKFSIDIILRNIKNSGKKN